MGQAGYGQGQAAIGNIGVAIAIVQVVGIRLIRRPRRPRQISMIARDAGICEETAQEVLKVGNAEMNGQSTENSRAATENSRAATENSRAATENSRRMLWAGLAERIRSDARSATARGHSSSLAAACLAHRGRESWIHGFIRRVCCACVAATL